VETQNVISEKFTSHTDLEYVSDLLKEDDICSNEPDELVSFREVTMEELKKHLATIKLKHFYDDIMLPSSILVYCSDKLLPTILS